MIESIYGIIVEVINTEGIVNTIFSAFASTKTFSYRVVIVNNVIFLLTDDDNYGLSGVKMA